MTARRHKEEYRIFGTCPTSVSRLNLPHSLSLKTENQDANLWQPRYHQRWHKLASWLLSVFRAPGKIPFRQGCSAPSLLPYTCGISWHLRCVIGLGNTIPVVHHSETSEPISCEICRNAGIWMDIYPPCPPVFVSDLSPFTWPEILAYGKFVLTVRPQNLHAIYISDV